MSGTAHYCANSYLAAHEDAERRTKRGERQRQCPTCNLWFWPDETCGCAARPEEPRA